MLHNKSYKLIDLPGLQREIWIRYDEDSKLYELFAEEECEAYLGCAENSHEIKTAVAHLVDEWTND